MDDAVRRLRDELYDAIGWEADKVPGLVAEFELAVRREERQRIWEMMNDE